MMPPPSLTMPAVDGGRSGGVVGWLLLMLMLVGDPLHLARCTLVTRRRGEHCQVQWLRLVNYHWGTLQ